MGIEFQFVGFNSGIEFHFVGLNLGIQLFVVPLGLKACFKDVSFEVCFDGLNSDIHLLQILLGGKAGLNQFGLFISKYLRLFLRKTDGLKAFDKRMGIKHGCCCVHDHHLPLF